MRLLRRLILSFAVLAIVPLLLMAGIWLGQQRRRLTADALQNVGNLARDAGREMDVVLGRSVEQVRQLAASTALLHQLEARTPETDADVLIARDAQWATTGDDAPLVRDTLRNPAADQLRRFQQTVPDRYAEILLTDRTGALVAATNRTSDYYQADEAWWQQVMSSHEGLTFINGLHRDESAGVLSLDISTPVRDAGGRAVGVIKVVHDAPALLDTLAALRPGRTGLGHLVNARGETILRAEGAAAPGAFGPALLERFRTEPRGVDVVPMGPGRGRHVVGHAMLRATVAGNRVTVDGAPWSVVVTQAASEVYAPTMATLLWAALLLLLPMAGFVLLVFYLRRRLAQPLKALFWASQQVSEGHLDVRVEIENADELEEMGHEFNKMAAALQRHEQRQREEIRRRTEELRQADMQARLVRETVSATMGSIATQMHRVTRELEGTVERPPTGAIGSAVGTLQELIEDLRDLCRVGGGPIKGPHVASVDAASLLSSVERVLRPLIEGYGATVDSSGVPADLPPIRTDRAKAKHVLYALVSNAVKYGGDKPVVYMSARRDGNATVLSVRDDGPGMDADTRTTVFLPLIGPPGRRQTTEERLGLRLSVAQQLVQSLGGSIWVESAPGAGSTFFVRLLDLEENERTADG